MILRSLPMLMAILIGDFALLRLLPGVDTASQRTLRYAPIFGLSAGLFTLGLALTWRMWRESPQPDLGAQGARSALSRLYAALLIVSVVGSIFFAYLVGKALVFRLDHETAWKDTLTYAAVAEAPLTSSEFWAGERAFTLPLLYKLLGINRAALNHMDQLRRITAFQFSFGILSWTTLATVTAGLLKTRWLRLAGFGAILAVNLSLDVSLWDRIPLSESVSTCLLVLLVSLLLLGLKYRHHLGWRGALWQIPYWLLLCALCILYSFTRDTNAYFLATCGLATLAGLGVRRFRRHPSATLWVVFSVFLLGLFLVQSRAAEQGKRWLIPYFNVLHGRIFPEDRARAFFLAAGMPADEWTLKALGRDRRRFMDELLNNPAARPLIDWVEASGRPVYIRYLLSQPGATFAQPISRVRNLLSPVSTEYRTDVYSVPAWLDLFSGIFFPVPLEVVIVWLGLVTAVMLWLGRLRRLRPEWIVPGLLLLTAFPMMFVVWYGDAVEVERHAFQISLQIRLGLWMLTFFGLDAWLAGSSTPNPGARSGGIMPGDQARPQS